MRILVISGDASFGPGHPRYELQRQAVDELALMFWGRGHLVPRVPTGRFDVVSAQDPLWRGLIGWCVAPAKKATFQVQVHVDLRTLNFFRRILAAFVLRRADTIRVVSETLKQQVVSLRVRGSVHVLPVFTDVERFRAASRQPHEGKVLLWVGRFENEKNPLLALKVFREVYKSLPETRLVFLGKGSLEKSLRAEAKGLPVEFVGWQDPLPYLQTADAVLSTSPFESWGAGIVEALAAGVPVVAPDVGVAKEAGATVVPTERLVEAVVEVIRSGKRAVLQLQMPSKEQWVALWKESMIPAVK